MPTLVICEPIPAIDVLKIPESEATHLARATLRAVARYFEFPGVKEDYEKWLIEYKKRHETKKPPKRN